MVLEKQMKKEFEKHLALAEKFQNSTMKFDSLMAGYYGSERYSDHDLDEIIDALDYGLGGLSFERFDSLMKEINRKGKDHD